MQVVILIYHITGSSSSTPIYLLMRILVSSFLFLNGFGHFHYFFKHKQQSILQLSASKTGPPIFAKLTRALNVILLGFFTYCRYPSTGPQNSWKLIKANVPWKLVTFMLTLKIGHAKSCLYYAFYILCQHCHLCPLSLTKCLFKLKPWNFASLLHKSRC